MKEEIKVILDKLYLDFEKANITAPEYSDLRDYITNLQEYYNDNVNKYEELLVKYSNLQEENERLKDEKPEYILRWKLEEQLEDYKQRNEKAIEILKDTNVNMPETLLIETIDYAIYILKGDIK